MDKNKKWKEWQGHLFIFSLSLIPLMSFGQKTAVKTNLLYTATTTPNIGIETRLSNTTSLELVAGYNPWSFGENKKLKHYLIQPEFRWWFCETFNGSFAGIHLLVGEYNAGGIKLPFSIFPSLKDYRYEGYFLGGGISIGHQWMLNNRWSVEATMGIGYIRTHFDKYPCEKCGKKIKSEGKNYFGPTKASISFIYYLW